MFVFPKPSPVIGSKKALKKWIKLNVYITGVV